MQANHCKPCNDLEIREKIVWGLESAGWRRRGYSRTKAGAPSRAPAFGREISPSPSVSRNPVANQTQLGLYEVVLGLGRETTSEVFLGSAWRKLPSLSTDCLKMKNTAYSFILRQQNKVFRAKTCLKMNNTRSFFILRHGNESSAHLAPQTAFPRARRASDMHLAPQTALSRAGRPPDSHLAPQTAFPRAR